MLLFFIYVIIRKKIALSFPVSSFPSCFHIKHYFGKLRVSSSTYSICTVIVMCCSLNLLYIILGLMQHPEKIIFNHLYSFKTIAVLYLQVNGQIFDSYTISVGLKQSLMKCNGIYRSTVHCTSSH